MWVPGTITILNNLVHKRDHSLLQQTRERQTTLSITTPKSRAMNEVKKEYLELVSQFAKQST